jgi:hypothetical protein
MFIYIRQYCYRSFRHVKIARYATDERMQDPHVPVANHWRTRGRAWVDQVSLEHGPPTWLRMYYMASQANRPYHLRNSCR